MPHRERRGRAARGERRRISNGSATLPIDAADARWQAHRRALLTLIALFAVTFVIFVGNNLVRSWTPRTTFAVAVPMIAGDMLIALPLVWLMTETGRGRQRAVLARFVLGTIGVAVAQGLWDTQVRIMVGAIKPDFGVKALANALPIDLYNTGMLAGLLAFQAAYHRVAAQRRALAAAQASERAAHLVALRLQLNPHFLFNTMNALSSLVVVGRNRDAEAMIAQLSDFLRHVLAADPDGLSRLDEEFETLDSYLAIEQIRFGERLRVEVALPAALGHLPVLPFLLQPLVENAIKYAVSPAERPVAIRVAATAADGVLELGVTDDGAGGAAVAGTGLGLANIRQRLHIEYGAGASLVSGATAEGFAATIRIPLAALQPRPSAASTAGR